MELHLSYSMLAIGFCSTNTNRLFSFGFRLLVGRGGLDFLILACGFTQFLVAFTLSDSIV